MNFKWFSSYFSFSKSQRSGLLVLLVLIVVLQTIYFFVDFSLPIKNNPEKDTCCENWIDVTRRETLEGAEQAIDSSVAHYAKKIEFANGPKVVKTFK